MAGREVNLINLRLVLHLAILHANEVGRPAGQVLPGPTPSSSGSADAGQAGATPDPQKRDNIDEALDASGPQAKKQKTDETLTKR